MLTRILLSCFVVYHLFAIIFSPAPESRVSYQAKPLYEAYAAFFEFAPTWNFFAPQPDPPTFTIEWELLDEKGDAFAHDVLPHMPDDLFFFRDRFNKRVTFVRFVMQNPDRVETVFGPFLCKSDSRAKSVRLWQGIYNVPKLEEVRQGKRKINDFQTTDKRAVAHIYCDQLKKPKAPTEFQPLASDPKPAVSVDPDAKQKESQL